jgi:membrane protein required for colicin V production
LTLFDIVAGLLVLASAMIGFSRGAVLEVVSLVSFTFAAMASVFLLPISNPIAHALVNPAWASKVVAILVVFLVAYIALRIAGASIAAVLHSQAALGALDRSLGFILGAGRGLVALGLFCLVFGAVTPRFLQPTWIVGGPIYGVGRASGALIASLAPSGLKAVGGFGRVMTDRVTADTDTAPDDPGASDPAADSGGSSGSSEADGAVGRSDRRPDDKAEGSRSAPDNSSDSAPYNAHRARHRRPATLTVINRPAE